MSWTHCWDQPAGVKALYRAYLQSVDRGKHGNQITVTLQFADTLPRVHAKQRTECCRGGQAAAAARGKDEPGQRL